MIIEIVATQRLNELWATQEEFASMTDAQILELIHEDWATFLECAHWEVRRLNDYAKGYVG